MRTTQPSTALGPRPDSPVPGAPGDERRCRWRAQADTHPPRNLGRVGPGPGTTADGLPETAPHSASRSCTKLPIDVGIGDHRPRPGVGAQPNRLGHTPCWRTLPDVPLLKTGSHCHTCRPARAPATGRASSRARTGAGERGGDPVAPAERHHRSEQADMLQPPARRCGPGASTRAWCRGGPCNQGQGHPGPCSGVRRVPSGPGDVDSPRGRGAQSRAPPWPDRRTPRGGAR